MMTLYFENCLERQYPDLIEISQNVIDALDKIVDLDELTFEELEEFVGQDMANHLSDYLAADKFGIYFNLIGYEVVSILDQDVFQGQLTLNHHETDNESSSTFSSNGDN